MAKRRWSEEEVDRLQTMRMQGVTYSKIAAELGRDKNATQMKMANLRKAGKAFLSKVQTATPERIQHFEDWYRVGAEKGWLETRIKAPN